MADHFDTIVSRHGEHGAQSILENWERFEGVCHSHTVSLEQRWDHFLRETNDNVTRIAA